MRLWELATDGNTTVEALAQALRDALSSSGLTQLDVESKTGIPDSTLSRYFKGTVKAPKPSVLAKLADVLNAPYEQLMALANYPLKAIPAAADEAQILEMVRAYPWAAGAVRDLAALRPEGRAAVFALIQALRRDGGTEPQ